MTQSSWVGRTLNGRYVIQELLGQGGMSAVYKANDPNLRRIVAVKLIHEHLSQDPEFVRRFEEEAAGVAQLRHPNLIQVFDFNNDGETFYIVFEFVPGETVQARLKRMKQVGRQMDTREAVDIVAQVADGLHYAHNKGLIHRDIKPANIMINVTGEPIVMDFGIAKIMGGTQHTATGAVLGTARYMSPEQIKGERIDPRTDIYSLGVTLFEMLGGRPPFEADSAMTLMMMHMTDPVPDLSKIRSDVQPQLAAVVEKALAKDARNRFQSGNEFAAALRNVDKGVAPAAGATIVERAQPKPPAPERTVVEPVVAPAEATPPRASRAAAPAAAVAAGRAARATGATPPAGSANVAGPTAPPTSGRAAAPPAGTSGPSRGLLYGGGAAVALVVIALIAYFAFLRGSGEEPTPTAEVPVVVAEATETPDAAATQAAADANVAAQVETRIAAAATGTAAAIAELSTDIPTPTLTATPPAGVTLEPAIDSVATVGEVVGDVTVTTANGQQLPMDQNTPITAGMQFVTAADSEALFTLQDGSIVQLAPNSNLWLDSVAENPADYVQETVFRLVDGGVLLRKPQVGNTLAIQSQAGDLLATLQHGSIASNDKAALSKRALQGQDIAAMSVGISTVRATVSCYTGTCVTGDGQPLRAGWQKIITLEGGFISSFPITTDTVSYQQWQEVCDNCLPQAQAPIPPTATSPPPTPTMEVTPTAEATPTEEAPAYFSQITGITLENRVYVIQYQTTGFTETLPGQHVHFYFDTVSEANAGVPGSGPWKLYGGPRPFRGYSEGDRPAAATAMCIRVANADHSIIPGTGNCYPLP